MAGDLFANRYRLIEPLGRGSMSAVWLAEDTELGRRVAVKTLGPTADRQRFAREARAVAALSHPNICALYDYGEADGRPFMVLEHLPNGTLEDRLADGNPLPHREVLAVATDIAAGLAHAHERGLVHRDLKPANVLFDSEGRAKIADFGIARMGGTGTLTEAGTVLGTASYISPEQAAGAPAGPESDVYSFGVVLFRMLTGRLPFVGKHAMEVVRMHRDETPPPVASLRPDAPASLAALADRSLAKDPAGRPANGAALLAVLRADEETAATLALPRVTGGRGRRRRILALAAIALLLPAAGGVLAYVLTRDTGTGEPAPPTALTLPTVQTEHSTTTLPTTAETATPQTTTRETSTAPTTTAPETTAPTTTTLPATVPLTTVPTTTAVPTVSVPATTVLPPTTTVVSTTSPETTTVSTP